MGIQLNSHLNILHLKRRQDRYDNLMKQLASNNITHYTIWEGYDEPKNVKQAISKGHRHIIGLAREQGLKNCIIAEDDVCFTHPNSYQYFLDQTPDDYDLFFGLVYSGNVNEENRVMTGMSGIMTLYNINSRFYDFFLDQPNDQHIDRWFGNFCHQYKFYVVPKYCVYQLGGYSDNLKRKMWYDVYLDGKELYKG